MTDNSTETQRNDRDARRELARQCLEAGVAAADPERAVREQVTLDDDAVRIGETTFDLGDYDRLLVVGGGKASAAVARGLEAVLGDRIDSGLVVTDGDGAEQRSASNRDTPGDGVDSTAPPGPERVEVAVGDHPVPSERNVAATERLVALLDAADERTLVLAPVTGGGSALLAAPTIPLDSYRALTEALVASGATIHEINAVRKRLSRVKGGGLAERATPATVVALLVSDVVGDDPATIASGPFAPDATSGAAALDVLARYDIETTDAVREAIESASSTGDSFAHVYTHLLATTRTAIDAAADRAREVGYDPLVLSSRMRGEARENALAHVAVAEEVQATGDPEPPPLALLSGGELTVTVRGDGEGGPNLEFALAAALELPDGVTLASVDTDGHDGGSDVAGAVVDSATLAQSRADADGPVVDHDLARQALASNDAFTYLADRDALLRIDSATNVDDLRVVLVDSGKAGTETDHSGETGRDDP